MKAWIAENIFIYVSLYMHTFILVGYVSQGEIAGSKGINILINTSEKKVTSPWTVNNKPMTYHNLSKRGNFQSLNFFFDKLLGEKI